MTIIKNTTKNIIEVSLDGLLKEEDFEVLTKTADDLIKEFGTVKVLVDASKFAGWESLKASQKHFHFVKDHHNKVSKLAVVAGHLWQHWIAEFMKMFVHPEVKIFESGKIDEAKEWLNS